MVSNDMQHWYVYYHLPMYIYTYLDRNQLNRMTSSIFTCHLSFHRWHLINFYMINLFIVPLYFKYTRDIAYMQTIFVFFFIKNNKTKLLIFVFSLLIGKVQTITEVGEKKNDEEEKLSL